MFYSPGHKATQAGPGGFANEEAHQRVREGIPGSAHEQDDGGRERIHLERGGVGRQLLCHLTHHSPHHSAGTGVFPQLHQALETLRCAHLGLAIFTCLVNNDNSGAGDVAQLLPNMCNTLDSMLRTTKDIRLFVCMCTGC